MSGLRFEDLITESVIKRSRSCARRLMGLTTTTRFRRNATELSPVAMAAVGGAQCRARVAKSRHRHHHRRGSSVFRRTIFPRWVFAHNGRTSISRRNSRSPMSRSKEDLFCTIWRFELLGSLKYLNLLSFLGFL